MQVSKNNISYASEEKAVDDRRAKGKKKKMEKELIKENISYNNHNKKCNHVLLSLNDFEEFVEDKEGRSEHENYLLMILEQEVHTLQRTIEAYKKELDKNHYKTIEELK